MGSDSLRKLEDIGSLLGTIGQSLGSTQAQLNKISSTTVDFGQQQSIGSVGAGLDAISNKLDSVGTQQASEEDGLTKIGEQLPK